MKKFLVLCGMLLCISGGAAFAGPSEGGMYYNDGLDYYAKGEYTKAIESFKEAVAKDPTLVDGYYNLGSLFEYLKSYQTAIIYYTKVTQLDPNDMETVLKLAELYNRTGSYEKAMFYAGKIPADSEFAQRASQLKTIIHDEKNHLAAIKSLANKPEVSEYIDFIYGPHFNWTLNFYKYVFLYCLCFFSDVVINSVCNDCSTY